MESVKVISRTETSLSPWVRLVSKVVEFEPGRQTETYHCFSLADYIAILARTRSGLIPVVRQYRPAVEAYTYELPAGLAEPCEDPAYTCRRELKEETGLTAEAVTYLGAYYVDTGRLENRLHVFFVMASDPDPEFVPEPGISVEFLDPATLRNYILSGKFQHQVHLGVLAVACMAGYWTL